MINRKTSVVAMIGCLLLAGISRLQAQPNPPAPRPAGQEVIVDFKSDDVLKKISKNDGVSISRTSDGALEVRVTPFDQHKNMWPSVLFGPDYFGRKINLADYTRLEVVLHHKTEGLSLVDFILATNPDTSSGVDDEQSTIPGYASATAVMPLTVLKNNDPSEVSVLQFIFRPRPTETVYQIESIRAVYDPAIGSPAEKLVAKVDAAKKQFQAIQDAAAKLPAEQRPAAEAQVAAIAGRLDKLAAAVDSAKPQQFFKSYRALSAQAEQVVNELGRARFLDAGPLLVWVPDRYPNFLRETGPDLQSELLKGISLSMAGNEYRDAVFSITAAGGDASPTISIRPTGTPALPAQAVTIRQSDYPKNPRGEFTGDALSPVQGPVQVPSGQTRQIWVRFDTRTTQVAPGTYSFELSIDDSAGAVKKTIPGKLVVWDFALPSYDVLPNNSYAIFSGGMKGDASGEKFRQAIADMKAYGFNHVFVEPPEIPVPAGVDDQWKITGYNDNGFTARVKGTVDAWKAAPGDGTVHILIALSNFEDLGLKKEGYAFQNDNWKKVLTQYINHLKSILAEAGLNHDQWMLVLRDESMEPVLIQWDIPFAEAIKSIDPAIRIKCNSSAILSDPQWADRYFKAFDLFQPHRGRDLVVQFLKKSGRPIWFYECDTGLTSLGRDLYDYYRLYPWDMLARGVVGTGVWTYYSAPHDRPWNEDFQGCQMIYLHPQHGLIHSRRYEMFREGADDYRYVAALRAAAKAKGPEAQQQAETLIADAIKDISSNRQDHSRAETWRTKIADQILNLK